MEVDRPGLGEFDLGCRSVLMAEVDGVSPYTGSCCTYLIPAQVEGERTGPAAQPRTSNGA